MNQDRIEHVRSRMADMGVDVLLLSVGADLPWLTGYEAMPLERLTMLVLPVAGKATLVVPALEAPRIRERPDQFDILPWQEVEDPVSIVASLAGSPRAVAIGDHTWSRFVIALQRALPSSRFLDGSTVTGALRAVKDAEEIEQLAAVAAAADRVAAQLYAGEIRLVGRTEHEVSEDIAGRLRMEGHDRVNFSIVASGPNGASPHHEAGSRMIGSNEAVVCDFGGTMNGYCSDITRTVFTGEPTAEMREVYEVVRAAQQAASDAAVVGVPCGAIDSAARAIITDAGYGEWFIHRTGHGIGVEAHEDPYLVEGNSEFLVAGNVFSIEPGIYLPGRFGIRIEDIVAATPSGPRSLNVADHTLRTVD